MQAMPHPHQLAALGTVLCQFQPRIGGELGGWTRAVNAGACSEVDSEGVHERLLFFDTQGTVCWQLHLLPDTDFLAWERLVAVLPAHSAPEEAGIGIAQRLWRRLAQGRHWHLDAMRLHALPPTPGFARLSVLAASPMALSPLGADTARRIARQEGIEASRSIDDCCCRRAAMRSLRPGPECDPASPSYPLIRFDKETFA